MLGALVPTHGTPDGKLEGMGEPPLPVNFRRGPVNR
jgi:hypothetical protein